MANSVIHTFVVMVLWSETLAENKVQECEKNCEHGCCNDVTSTCCNTLCGNEYCIHKEEFGALDILWRILVAAFFFGIMCGGFKKIIRTCRNNSPDGIQNCLCGSYRIHLCTGCNWCQNDSSDLEVQQVTNIADEVIQSNTMSETGNSRPSLFPDFLTRYNITSRDMYAGHERTFRPIPEQDSGIRDELINFVDESNTDNTSINELQPPPSYETATRNDPPRYNEAVKMIHND